jgi:hypothetical protein
MELFASKQTPIKIFSQHSDKKFYAVYTIDQARDPQHKIEFYRKGKKSSIAYTIPKNRVRLMWWDKKKHIFYAILRTNETQEVDVRYMR